MSSNYLWTNFIAFIAITVFFILNAMDKFRFNSFTLHIRDIHTLCFYVAYYTPQSWTLLNLNIFAQCIEKVVITIIVRMSQYRYTVVFSYHFISNETYIRLLGSPVPVNKSVSQLLEHLTRSRFSELRLEFW